LTETAASLRGDAIVTDASNAMIAASLLRTRLSDDEIAELGDFLQHRCLPVGGMPISMLDGFLTAIASCPEFIAPSEWLPRVWSAGDDAHPDQERPPDDDIVFESTEEAQRLTSLVLRRMSEIMRAFDQGTVEPIFLKHSAEDGADCVSADVWCLGYLTGMEVHEAAWEPLTSPDSDAGDFLAPILALALPLLNPDDDDDIADEVGDDVVDDDVDDDDFDDDDALIGTTDSGATDEVTELIPDCAYAINQYWRERQRLLQGTIRRTPRPGRNSACPCGSGRKYKKCCGRS
jgi:uncharacterized protein